MANSFQTINSPIVILLDSRLMMSLTPKLPTYLDFNISAIGSKNHTVKYAGKISIFLMIDNINHVYSLSKLHINNMIVFRYHLHNMVPNLDKKNTNIHLQQIHENLSISTVAAKKTNVFRLTKLQMQTILMFKNWSDCITTKSCEK